MGKKLYVWKYVGGYGDGIIIADKENERFKDSDWKLLGTFTEWIKNVRKEGGDKYYYIE